MSLLQLNSGACAPRQLLDVQQSAALLSLRQAPAFGQPSTASEIHHLADYRGKALSLCSAQLEPGSQDRRGPRALSGLRLTPEQGPWGPGRITSPVSGLRLGTFHDDLNDMSRLSASLHLPISTEGGTCFCSSLMRIGKPRC